MIKCLIAYVKCVSDSDSFAAVLRHSRQTVADTGLFGSYKRGNQGKLAPNFVELFREFCCFIFILSKSNIYL